MAQNVFGVDIGTSSIKIYNKNLDTVLNEKNVIAIQNKNSILAVGNEAYDMYEKAPDSIFVSYPVKFGVIADIKNMQSLFEKLVNKSRTAKYSYQNADFCFAVPTDITEVEKRAVLEAAISAGAKDKDTYLIEEPMAASIGAGLPVEEPTGSMIVDIGGGTSEVAVISLGGIVTSTSLRIAGDELDNYIVNYIKKEFNLAIGDRTAEEIKIAIGCVYPTDEVREMNVRGRDLLSGLPKTVVVTSTEIMEALHEPVYSIIDTIKQTLEATPPELAADVMESGITLTGGGALLRGLDYLISDETGMPVHIGNEPLNCVATGTGLVLEHIDTLKAVLISPRKIRF